MLFVTFQSPVVTYQAKLAEQKKLREQILAKKAAKRKQQASETKSPNNSSAVNKTAATTNTITTTNATTPRKAPITAVSGKGTPQKTTTLPNTDKLARPSVVKTAQPQSSPAKPILSRIGGQTNNANNPGRGGRLSVQQRLQPKTGAQNNTIGSNASVSGPSGLSSRGAGRGMCLMYVFICMIAS